MNILLFGKTGQVGWELQRALAPLGNLIALDVHSTDYCGDFSNPEGVAETVRSRSHRSRQSRIRTEVCTITERDECRSDRESSQ